MHFGLCLLHVIFLISPTLNANRPHWRLADRLTGVMRGHDTEAKAGHLPTHTASRRDIAGRLAASSIDRASLSSAALSAARHRYKFMQHRLCTAKKHRSSSSSRDSDIQLCSTLQMQATVMMPGFTFSSHSLHLDSVH